MVILLVLYVTAVVVAFILGAIDMKQNLGWVDVGDLCFLTIMSLIPIGNIGVMLAAGSGILRRKCPNILGKRVW